MTDVFYTNLRGHLELPPLEYHYLDDRSNVLIPHEDVLQYFDLDTRDVQLTSTTPRASPEESDEYYEDEYGIGYRKHGVWFYYPVKYPLAGKSTVADVEDYPWPDLAGSVQVSALQELVRGVRQQSDCVLVMNVGGTMFSLAWRLCGDDWFVHIATNEAFVDALMEKLLELQMGYAQRILSATGPDGIDVAICTTDDHGMQTGPLISVQHYRRFFKPRQRAFIEFVKQHSNAKIFMHNDGAIYPLISDFIDIGVEILNPVQVECAGMARPVFRHTTGCQR
jgi:uroporphyrinogen decarboxylase